MDPIANGFFSEDEILAWPSWAGQHVFPEVMFYEVMFYEVREISWRIPLGKAPDPDRMPVMVIKEVAAKKLEILRDIFNFCL